MPSDQCLRGVALKRPDHDAMDIAPCLHSTAPNRPWLGRHLTWLSQMQSLVISPRAKWALANLGDLNPLMFWGNHRAEARAAQGGRPPALFQRAWRGSVKDAVKKALTGCRDCAVHRSDSGGTCQAHAQVPIPCRSMML